MSITIIILIIVTVLVVAAAIGIPFLLKTKPAATARPVTAPPTTTPPAATPSNSYVLQGQHYSDKNPDSYYTCPKSSISTFCILPPPEADVQTFCNSLAGEGVVKGAPNCLGYLQNGTSYQLVIDNPPALRTDVGADGNVRGLPYYMKVVPS